MKLCFVANVLDWYDDFHAIVRAKALAGRGHEVVFICGPGPSQVDLDVHLIPMRERSTEIGRLWESIRFKLAFFNEIRRCDADAYITVYSTGVAAWVLYASGRTPHVAMVIGSDAYHEISGLDPEEASWADRSYRDAAMLTSESPHLTRKLESLGIPPERILTMTWGIKTHLFDADTGPKVRERYGISDDVPLIFAPRGFKTVYAPELTMKAFQLLLDSHPEARMVMLGVNDSPEFRDHVLPLCKSLGLEDSIIFPGPVPLEAMSGFYRSAQVTVSTSLSDGAPNTTFESLYCGTPVVMGYLKNYDGLFTHGKDCLFADLTPESVAEQMRSLLEDPSLKDRLVREGQAMVMRTADNEANLARLERRLEELAKSAPGRKGRPKLRFLLQVLLQPLMNRFKAPATPK